MIPDKISYKNGTTSLSEEMARFWNELASRMTKLSYLIKFVK